MSCNSDNADLHTYRLSCQNFIKDLIIGMPCHNSFRGKLLLNSYNLCTQISHFLFGTEGKFH